MSLSDYIAILDRQPLLSPYHHPSQEITEFLKGKDQRALNQAVMAELIHQFPTRLEQARLQEGVELTPDAVSMFQQDFDRILNQQATNPPDFYEFPKSPFAKDLGLCSLRIMPAGAQIVDLHSGIGRRLLLGGGLSEIASRLHFFVNRLGGFNPLYQIHTHSTSYPEFNEAGWDRCYLRIAGMLRVNPHVRGMFGISWFYDPALESISPRLNYLRHRPLEGGARLFREGVSDEHIGNATAKSETRKKLFLEGKYQPTGYAMVWPRRELIAWADQARG